MNIRQRLARTLTALGFVFALGAGSAHADGSVSALHMGMGARDAYAFGRFQQVISQYNSSGERFRIDSHCQSACTMFLSIRNVCVTPGATLLFHAGGSMAKGIINPGSTQAMLMTYNAALQKYVTEHHFMETLEFHSISGSEIIHKFGYPACR